MPLIFTCFNLVKWNMLIFVVKLVKSLWHTECNLRQLSEDKQYAYITYQDLRGIPEYRHQTIMAIKAPPEAKLQVPHPSQVSMNWILKYLSMCVFGRILGWWQESWNWWVHAFLDLCHNFLPTVAVGEIS
jgi:hypothetical protein